MERKIKFFSRLRFALSISGVVKCDDGREADSGGGGGGGGGENV